MVSQGLEVLHNHTQTTHAEAVLQSLAVCAVIHAGAVVEALLCLAPIAPLGQVWAQERRVDAAEISFRDVRLEDVGPNEEDIAQLPEELEAFLERGDAEGDDGILVKLQVSASKVSIEVGICGRDTHLASIKPPVALTGNFLRCSSSSLQQIFSA